MTRPPSSQVCSDAGLPLLSDKELAFFINLIYEECGIHLKPEKRSMISARLNKRLRALKLHTFQEYLDYLKGADNRVREIISMVDAVTTNKTDFFREARHFEFLTQTGLPERIRSRAFQASRQLQVWSAACSTGEEPYTLAMVLEDFFSRHEGDYTVLATDIDTRVLKAARQAVYPQAQVEPVPRHFRRKYLMEGRGPRQGQYRVVPELRAKVTFGRLNFMDQDYRIGTMMDIIFCRNVLIYFDWETKARVVHKLYRYLKPGGYLFVGHSETLNGIDLDLRRVMPTVFQKNGF